MTETHAQFAPSKMSRIMACSASFDAQDSSTNKFAEEGTMLHDKQAFVMLEYKKLGMDHAVTIIDGMTFPDEFDGTDAEYRDYLHCCLEYVNNIIKQAALDFPSIFNWETVMESMVIEERVSLSDYDPDLIEVHGTPDLRFTLIYNLHVIDWKFGMGYVAAKHNKQLMIYAAGSIESPDELDGVTMHIVQPKISNYSSFDLHPATLHFWVTTEVLDCVQAIQEGIRNYNPGEAQCQWCPDRGDCDARNENALVLAQQVFAEYVNVTDRTNALIASGDTTKMMQVLGMAKDIEVVIKAITAHGHSLLSSGEEFPGHKLVRGKSNRVWVDEETAAQFLMDYGVDDSEIYKQKLLTPAQGELLLERKDRKEEVFTSLITKPLGKITMVKDSDPREPLQCGAEATFKHLAVDK